MSKYVLARNGERISLLYMENLEIAIDFVKDLTKDFDKKLGRVLDPPKLDKV